MYYQEPIVLTAEQAIEILNAVPCVVKLNTNSKDKEYTTKAGVVNELVYIYEFDQFVHIHNIESIKVADISSRVVSLGFVSVNWLSGWHTEII